MRRVFVIGGGAAGMMAAIAAAEQGHAVVLAEKNEKLGKKLYITGKGRCNVTNDCDVETLLKNVVTNAKFLYSAFYTFDSSLLKQYIEEEGCPLKVERGERVFPVSDHSSDVIGALKRRLNRLRVEVRLGTEVKAILADDVGRRVAGVCLADGTKEKADAVILAGGGLSYPSTGSDGGAFKLAEKMGHSVTKCVPSLVPIVTEEDWCAKLQGLSLKNVAIQMRQGKNCLYEDFGEMLFTHFGISGPIILSASAFLPKKEMKEPVEITLDLKPALTEEQLDKRILRDFSDAMNRQFKNSLDKLLPGKMIPVILELSGIDPEKKVNLISREERQDLAALLKHLKMTVRGTRGFDEAIITKGGVNVKEVDPSTMESKLVNGLYLAGEMLDLDALTGGFNRQITILPERKG